jgi:hypothetical protein
MGADARSNPNPCELSNSSPLSIAIARRYTYCPNQKGKTMLDIISIGQPDANPSGNFCGTPLSLHGTPALVAGS